MLFAEVLMMCPAWLEAQKVQRPALYGIAKMTYRISSFELAQRYFGEFLGFDKAFTYSSENGEIETYKVNDRQFIEFVEDENAPVKNRVVSVSFETDDVSQMRDYLRSKNIPIIKDVYIDGAGNRVLLVRDPADVPIEIIEYTSSSLHMKSKGKFLSSNRISTRIHHAGLYSDTLEDESVFYTQVLGFEQVFRFPVDKKETPRILYFRLPESAEMIEHYPTQDANFTHPCFVTMDIQETISVLRERKKDEVLPPPSIGMGKRWLLNIWTRDGMKVEFTEPYISVF